MFSDGATAVWKLFLHGPHEKEGVFGPDKMLDFLFSLPFIKQRRGDQAALCQGCLFEEGLFKKSFLSGVEYQFFAQWKSPQIFMKTILIHRKRKASRMKILFLLHKGGQMVFLITLLHFSDDIQEVDDILHGEFQLKPSAHNILL